MAATLQRKYIYLGGITFGIATKMITKENVPRNYFVMFSARMEYQEPPTAHTKGKNMNKSDKNMRRGPCETSVGVPQIMRQMGV